MPRAISDAGHKAYSLILVIYLSDEAVNFFLSLVTSVAITFLNHTDQLIQTTVNTVQVVVGQLAPELLNTTTDLFPLAHQDILIDSRIHSKLLFSHSFKTLPTSME